MKLKTAFGLLLLGFLLGFFVSYSNLTALAGFPVSSNALPAAAGSDSSNISVFFCPADSCDSELIRHLDSAQKHLDIAVYSFTLDSVADAVIRAKARGVPVRVITDSVQAAGGYSADEKLEAAGISLKRVDLYRGSMHHKFAVIDSKTVGTGSYNYSQNATEYNNENLVFITNPAVAKAYADEFERIWNEN